jgi:cobalamin synthase
VNLTALGLVVVISVVFSLPPNELVLWTMLLVALVLATYWRASARRHFRGPAATPTA